MINDETYISNRKPDIPPARGVSYSAVPSVEYGDEEDRREKPWQRVYHAVTRKGTHLYEPVRSVPSAFLLVLLGVGLLLGYLMQLLEDDMPRAVHEADMARDSAATFSEEASWRYLTALLGEEPRVAGTPAHLAQTRVLKDMLDAVAAQAALPVHTDWQLVSGDYWLAMKPPFVNCYQNLSNVVALLEGEAGFLPDGTPGASVLVNCHYDSVPFALGASDNGVFCAVMLETLSRLSQRKQKLKHNIIFLFNGAEENPLQGSHGFLQHRWARGVVNVVNLDAVGMNGKPTVFQVSDPRVLAAYAARARRPSAQSVGEFLFATGIIPSDTDFRVWRDFGDIHGIDIAFVKWSNVYHTRYDHPALLRPGVMQNAGDMLLALLPQLADDEDLARREPPQTVVFYDYLGWFLVRYSPSAAVAVDVSIALVALLSVAYYVWLVGCRKSSLQGLAAAVAGRLLAAGAGLAAVALATALMLLTTVQLRYLSEEWLVVPLYWMPYLIGAVLASHGFDAWRSKKSGLSRSVRALQAGAGARLALAALLLALSAVPAAARVRYVLALPLLLMALAAAASITLLRCVRLAAWQQLVVEVVLATPALAWLSCLALRLDAALLPALGRAPAAAPDLTAALVNAGLAAMVAAPLSGVELLFSRRRLWLPAGALGAACLVLMLLPLEPYRDDGPAVQRHYWFHTEIVSFDANGSVSERAAGVLVTAHDALTSSRALELAARRGLLARTDWADDCAARLFCDLPLYRPRFSLDFDKSVFLYTEGPAPLQPAPSLRVTSRSCLGELCTLHFTMIGPAHSTVSLWPRAGASLARWSLAAAPRASLALAGRPAYLLVHSAATYSDTFPPFNFTVEFIVPLSQQRAPLLDASHHAHLIAHPERFTAQYRALLAAAPDYFNIASFVSWRHNYVF